MNLNTIRASYGTAIVLGLIKAKQDTAPTTAYLLWDKGCLGQCSFCHRAGGNEQSEKLARILWPEFELDIIIEKLSKSPPPFDRICLQTAYNPAHTAYLKTVAQRLLKLNLPLSMTLNASQHDFALEMLQNGLDHIGIGLDAASKETYHLHKKRNWEADIASLTKLLELAKDKIEVHLIYGLGDSEELFIKTMESIIKMGGKISLFAFTPIAKGKQPEIVSYRKIQVIRYLLEKQSLSLSDCRFKEGKLIGLNISHTKLVELLDYGDAFRTSGCKNCNRPFYNEKPGQEPYNYPRKLSSDEFATCLSEFKKDLIISK